MSTDIKMNPKMEARLALMGGKRETYKDRVAYMRSPGREQPELMHVPMTDMENDNYARIARAFDAAKAVKTDKNLIHELAVDLVFLLHTERGLTTFAHGGVGVTINPNIVSSNGLPGLTVVVKR